MIEMEVQIGASSSLLYIQHDFLACQEQDRQRNVLLIIMHIDSVILGVVPIHNAEFAVDLSQFRMLIVHFSVTDPEPV